METDKLNSALEQIGLTHGEIKVYLALLELGSTTTGPLTDRSGVSRSKIYNVLERLIQKGLASYIIRGETRFFQAAEPLKIFDYLESKEEEIKKQRRKVSAILPILHKRQMLSERINKVQVFEGFKGIQTVHEHTYLKLKKGEEYFFLGIPPHQDERYHMYWQKDHKKRIKAGIKCRLLFNFGTDSKILINRNSFEGVDARMMPIPIETPSMILGYKDVTAIIIESGNGMAIEIINQEVADSFRRYFDVFWKMTKPFDAKKAKGRTKPANNKYNKVENTLNTPEDFETT
ncbi:MAG: TrmB family transcriptional regulator [Candidatus Micrarchaeota archaeon]|nr:TrmB family transcriptional regulator [Candidatus Micrarchaeota archaeon]